MWTWPPHDGANIDPPTLQPWPAEGLQLWSHFIARVVGDQAEIKPLCSLQVSHYHHDQGKDKRSLPSPTSGRDFDIGEDDAHDLPRHHRAIVVAHRSSSPRLPACPWGARGPRNAGPRWEEGGSPSWRLPRKRSSTLATSGTAQLNRPWTSLLPLQRLDSIDPERVAHVAGR